MSLLSVIGAHPSMHVAGLLGVAALAFRNQLRLRAVLLVSIVVNIVDHAFLRGAPLWDVLFWDAVALAVNTDGLIRLVLDRTHIGLSGEERDLFRAFAVLSPGEFRQLVRLGEWRTVEEATEITREGANPTHLFYVVDGGIRLEKSGRTASLEPQTFIGEVAFLKGRTASATVTLMPATRFIQWPAPMLQRCLDRKMSMRVAVFRLLGADMAAKVARA